MWGGVGGGGALSGISLANSISRLSRLDPVYGGVYVGTCMIRLYNCADIASFPPPPLTHVQVFMSVCLSPTSPVHGYIV